jgi:hypothetical protein
MLTTSPLHAYPLHRILAIVSWIVVLGGAVLAGHPQTRQIAVGTWLGGVGLQFVSGILFLQDRLTKPEQTRRSN